VTVLVVMVLAGIGTYLARASFVLAVGDRRLHPALERVIRNVGPAVLSALTASLLFDEGVVEFLRNVPEVASALVAVVLAWRFRNFLVAFGGSVVVLLVLSAVA
jgi:branched-subunit amino acid transport protein